MSDSSTFLSVTFTNGTPYDFNLPNGAFVWNTGTNAFTESCSLESSPGNTLVANEGNQYLIAKSAGLSDIPIVGPGPVVETSCYWTNSDLNSRFGIAVSFLSQPGVIPFTTDVTISWQYTLDNNPSGAVSWITPATQTAQILETLNLSDGGSLILNVTPTISENTSIFLSCTINLNSKVSSVLTIKNNDGNTSPGMACVMSANGIQVYFGNSSADLGPFVQQLSAAMKTNSHQVVEYLQGKFKDKVADDLYKAFFEETSSMVVNGQPIVVKPAEPEENPSEPAIEDGAPEAEEGSSVSDMLAEYGTELEILFA